jgi:5-methylcytosine-specific restriction protein A
MRIADLPNPVSAVKGHWNPEFPERSSLVDGWVGFTPPRDDVASRQQLRATVSRQMGNGYVLEYVSMSRPPPNHNSRPLTPEDKATHTKAAGSLTAVFKLANRPAHAQKLIAPQEYEDIQDRWDKRGDRVRWSEAYPIIEAWEIVGWPKARDVLGLDAARRRCEQLSPFLKVLDDGDRAKLSAFELAPINLPADGLAAQYFRDLAIQSNRLNGRSDTALTPEDRCLSEDYSSVEGMTKEQRVHIVLRDRHLVRLLKRNAPLKCMVCSYDPTSRGANPRQARAILEAHHTLPIHSGERLSTVRDLVLLCPTCHREVHQGLMIIPLGRAATHVAPDLDRAFASAAV